MTAMASSLLVLTLVPGQLDWRVVSCFQPLEHRSTDGRYRDEPFRYRLFVPPSIAPGEKYPLLLWLHGRGDSGTDNAKQLMHMQFLLNDPDRLDKHPFFILVPQCPEDRAWFDGHRTASASSEAAKGDELLDVASEMLDETIAKHPIDVDRVYLLGISTGGTAAWEMAMRDPERFAAIAPLGSAGGESADIGRLREVPVWAFHCTRDTWISIDLVANTIDALREAGGTAALTAIDREEHGCWRDALADYRVVSWMLRQRRGSLCWPPPGDRPWPPWQMVGQAVIALLILAAVWSGWRWRRRRARQESESRRLGEAAGPNESA
jgi:predicted peptidase